MPVVQSNKKKHNSKGMDKINEVDSHITQRYEIRKRLGKGAYGIVWKAIDRRSGDVVALKKIFDAFRNPTDAQRTFREILFLQEFRHHPNVIRLLNVIRADSDRDIYLVFEYMDTDLHHVIKKQGILKDIHKRYIMYQLFRATKYLHSAEVIHRDQKPSNILLDADCNVKVADFGLARSLSTREPCDTETEPPLTDYVATRWYRAPEILLSAKSYTKGVDMWSLGCILAEMLLERPLFPGTSTINQIERIMATLDTPSPQDVASVCSGYASSLLDRAVLTHRRPLTAVLASDVPPDALDLVTKLLVFNPSRRLTADEALRHPYVKGFHNPSKEPSFGRAIVPPVDDSVQLSVEAYRSRLYDFIAHKKGHARGDRPLPHGQASGHTAARHSTDRKRPVAHVEVELAKSKPYDAGDSKTPSPTTRHTPPSPPRPPKQSGDGGSPAVRAAPRFTSAQHRHSVQNVTRGQGYPDARSSSLRKQQSLESVLTSGGSRSESAPRPGRPVLSQLKAAFVRSLDYTNVRREKPVPAAVVHHGGVRRSSATGGSSGLPPGRHQYGLHHK
ncbi:extracellular signal-regulated kinase 2-like isoform X2 [Pollicipes pollicipes]|uniref:extracellular signal-regulated kinase 2-like isoform X2 n=1 Tax=Pollicipes pollicipes TaxID=41117 RepID=UPI001885747E|nr:extracellular signal-regulated kinase 2-like isoform X2 [Pollicipes pollicipes]